MTAIKGNLQAANEILDRMMVTGNAEDLTPNQLAILRTRIAHASEDEIYGYINTVLHHCNGKHLDGLKWCVSIRCRQFL